MAGAGPEDLQELCQEFLDACIEALDTVPVFAPGLGGAPERSYISPGQSADDCCPDQLTVWPGGAACRTIANRIGNRRTKGPPNGWLALSSDAPRRYFVPKALQT